MRRVVATAMVSLMIGCSNPQQAAQIERLKSQLDDADRRLEIASQQLESAVDHAARLERAMKAAEQESAATKREAEERSQQLIRELNAAQGELQTANKRLTEIARKEQEDAVRLSPVGVWAAGSQRFMFFANGTGVFHYWDPRQSKWGEGLTVSSGWKSNGRFDYRPDGLNGEYLLRYSGSRITAKKVGEKRSDFPGSTAMLPVYENVQETKPVELQFMVLSSEEARVIGQGSDSVLKRVNESWTPQSGDK